MKITRQIVAEKITDYLHGKLSQAELVDWAEHAMTDANFEDSDSDLLTDIVGRVGVADVAESAEDLEAARDFYDMQESGGGEY
jgi:hypothetical protein